MVKNDSFLKGEKEMSVPEKDITLRNHTLWEIAEKNTKRNSDGLTVSSSDCPFREDPQWEKTVIDSEK